LQERNSEGFFTVSFSSVLQRDFIPSSNLSHSVPKD
jgi:hypothetical protein